jgi:hypothetical protein
MLYKWTASSVDMSKNDTFCPAAMVRIVQPFGNPTEGGESNQLHVTHATTLHQQGLSELFHKIRFVNVPEADSAILSGREDRGVVQPVAF